MSDPEPHHALAQAPVAPVDADGVAAAQLGTGVFVALSVACLVWRPALEARGDGWWLWVCLTGTGLGVVMVAFTRWRRSRHAGAAASVEEGLVDGDGVPDRVG